MVECKFTFWWKKQYGHLNSWPTPSTATRLANEKNAATNFQSLGNISVDWELRLSSSFFPNRTINIAIAMLQKQENPFIMKLLDKQSNYVESEFCIVMIKENSHAFWFSRKR